jgi:hypothetical protein
MLGKKGINDMELSVKENNLYQEEFFTDLDMASIRRLTPVKPNGVRDKSRKLVFVGNLNLMTPQGPLPVQAAIDARNLKEALERYPEAMKNAFGEMEEKIKKLQQEKESKIIVPGT